MAESCLQPTPVPRLKRPASAPGTAPAAGKTGQTQQALSSLFHVPVFRLNSCLSKAIAHQGLCTGVWDTPAGFLLSLQHGGAALVLAGGGNQDLPVTILLGILSKPAVEEGAGSWGWVRVLGRQDAPGKKVPFLFPA